MSLPELTTETIQKCIVCDSISHVQDIKFGDLLGLVKPYAVQQCTNCGLRWLSPRPDKKGYDKLYSYDVYFSYANYEDIARSRRFYFCKRIEKIEKFLGRKNLEILEIGAATGEFCHEARLRGHHTTGLELSDGARKTALEKHGIQLSRLTVEELPREEKFDVIHMNHVLEHMPDPASTLDECHKRLKKDGVVVIEIPQQIYNDLDNAKRLLGIAKKPEFTPYSLHHTYFFTPALIAQLFEKTGFKVNILRTANPHRTPLRPFSWSNYILGPLLLASDLVHKGGNIIEVYASKK